MGWSVNPLFDLLFETPRSSGYVVLDREGRVHGEISYATLAKVSRHRAGWLQRQLPDAAPECIVGLVYHDPLAFLTTWFACVFSGWVAVALRPVDVLRRGDAVRRTLRELDALAVVTEPGLARIPGVEQLGVPVFVAVDTGEVGVARPVHPDRPVYVQRSSGTTGAAKPVALSARNICANEVAIQAHFGHSPRSRVLGWLPHTHDLGLFGTLLQPLFVDCLGYLSRPESFVREPLSWLHNVDRYAITTSGAPTFAYRRCAQRRCDPDLELDLSSWSVAFIGAEPVTQAVLDDFTETFAPFGFARRALMPCYGLAEATLFVCAESRDRVPRCLNDGGRLIDGVRLGDTLPVSVGSVLGSAAQIELRPLPLAAAGRAGDRVGEILLRGPSVAVGHLTRSYTGRSWLATGDLGLIRDGALYVVSRLKDVAKIRGVGISLSDLDDAARRWVATRAPAARVCSLDLIDEAGEPQLWLLVQPRSVDEAARLDAIRLPLEAQLLGWFGVKVRAEILPASPRLIAMTASGKLNRVASRTAYLEAMSRHGRA